jgi:hypothetical protein
MVADNLGVFAATTSLQLKNVISDETGSGALVFATSPTLVTPVLGTPTSGNLGNCTAYPGDASLVTTGTITSGTWNGSVIASAYLDADTAHLSGAQTFTAKKTMTSTGSGDAGINLGSSATAPTTNLANGDIYYNTTDNKLYGRINAAWVDLGQSGSEVTTWTQDHSAGNFNLDDGNSIYLNEKAAANADIAGDGQIWVKTATPNELWFTDDAGTDFQVASKTGTHAATESFVIACSDESTAITATGEKVEFRMPYAFTVTEVRASLTSACTTGTFTVDIHESGTTIMTTNKITIDATEKTSETAATAPGITDSALADDAEIQIDVDNVGDSTATGLKVYIIGYKT